jgi:uncharacterized membrane protein YGL010W
MSRLIKQLSTYALYHRDRRNIATHLFGIPMIVLGLQALMARAAADVGGAPISLALVASVAATVYYLALDIRYGVAMAAFLGATLWGGTVAAGQSLAVWLTASAVLFVGGWIIQFIGHAFEGKKPAFVDDLVGLLIGPLFIVAEVGFAIGLRNEVREEIELIAGPTRARTVRTAAAG